jgi:hypothetical protein
LRYSLVVPGDYYRTLWTLKKKAGKRATKLPRSIRPTSKVLWQVSHGAFIGLSATPILLVSLFAALGASHLEPLGWVSFAGIALLNTYFRRRAGTLRIVKELDARNAEALRLLDEDPDAALAELSRIADASGRSPAAHSVYLMNVAVALLRVGEAPQAYKLLQDVEKGRWLEKTSLLRALQSNLTTAAIVVGDLAAAQQWLQTTERGSPPSRRPQLTTNRALLAARKEKFADCVRILDEGAHDASRTLDAASLGMLRFLRAYAQSRANPEAAAESLDVARSVDRASFEYLTVLWPELEAFARKCEVEEGPREP